MLTMDDCIGLCGLTEDEIDAIAEHEHITVLVAAELGNCLMNDVAGRRRIASIICDDIEMACANRAAKHATRLVNALQVFIHDNPDASLQGKSSAWVAPA